MRLENCKKHIRIIDDIVQDESVFGMMMDDHSAAYRGQSVGESFLTGPYMMLHPAPGILFMLSPRTLTMFELHTMIKKEARGKNALIAARKATAYLFKNSSCEKIITMVPEFNKPAMIFARRFGFLIEGVCKQSFRRDGKLTDQVMFGLEKERFLCQQSQQ